MDLKQTELDGLFVVESRELVDGRGSFMEAWNRQVFLEHGIDFRPDQVNVSMSASAGTIRGMHWQAPPAGQKKLVRCIEGEVYDVVVDVRKDSPSYGRNYGIDLSGSSGRMLYIPEGFAHGWQALSRRSRIEYLVEGFWNKDAERGLPPTDRELDIPWARPMTAIAKRDEQWPAFVRGTTCY